MQPDVALYNACNASKRIAVICATGKLSVVSDCLKSRIGDGVSFVKEQRAEWVNSRSALYSQSATADVA